MFPTSYEESRDRFAGLLDGIQQRWPAARLDRHPIGDERSDLTVDIIHADPNTTCNKVVILTTGQHGIEGYVGSAVLQLFARTYLEQLDPQTTGLALVHAINPWGMKHRRRTDQDNVDLNRNFVIDWSALDPAINGDYRRAAAFFGPKGPVPASPMDQISYLSRTLGTLLRLGPGAFRTAALLGQYEFAGGIYYGGRTHQPATRLVIDLYRHAMRKYGRVLHLDIHTGFGPRYQMSIVNSALEERPPAELRERFAYSLVVRATAGEFYAIHGDMVDFVYRLGQEEFPGKPLYSTCLEFGTMGDSTIAGLQSLRRIINENRSYRYGSRHPHIQEQIRADFDALFYPQEDAWRKKAMADARQALGGILRSEGFL